MIAIWEFGLTNNQTCTILVLCLVILQYPVLNVLWILCLDGFKEKNTLFYRERTLLSLTMFFLEKKDLVC